MLNASRSFSPHDPCDPRWWAGRLLRYSALAEQRCQERGVPPLVSLPIDSRLVDRDLGDSGLEAVVFKVQPTEDPFFAVLGVDGSVITVFLNSQEYAAWQRGKKRRRSNQSRC